MTAYLPLMLYVLIETLWNVKRAQAKWFDAAKRY